MIATQVKQLISVIARVDPRIRDEAALKDLGIHPYNHTSLATTLEGDFFIAIPMREVRTWRTVADVIKSVQSQGHTHTNLHNQPL